MYLLCAYKPSPQVVLVLGREQTRLYAHSPLLIECSDVFSTLFSNRWRGGQALDAAGRRTIEYKNIEPEVMLVLLEWVNTGRISVTGDREFLYAVLEAAEFLGIKSLLDAALKEDSREYSDLDIKTLLVFAEKHKHPLATIYPLYHKIRDLGYMKEMWFMKETSFIPRSLIAKMIFMQRFDIDEVEPIFAQIEEAASLTEYIPLVRRCFNATNQISWDDTARKAVFLIVVFQVPNLDAKCG
jgi:hypothetical protein